VDALPLDLLDWLDPIDSAITAIENGH